MVCNPLEGRLDIALLGRLRQPKSLRLQRCRLTDLPAGAYLKGGCAIRRC